MPNDLKELPLERLGSMDEHGHKLNIHPSDVDGRFMRRRMAFQIVLLVVFLILPWIQINGHPAILLNIAQRRFAIFGLTFWAHDAPMLIFVAGTVLFGISLVTAVWGRVWCGWACPETVFVERVYRGIERWIEGNAVQRRRLDKSPWNGEKLLKRGGKWLAFLAVSLIITHSFLAYFIGIDQLAVMTRHNPAENPTPFGIMAFLTVVLLVFFGWFREQFCVIMCPYGRFQSVLQDANSKMVIYDIVRGEPRRPKLRGKAKQAAARVHAELLQIEPEAPAALTAEATATLYHPAGPAQAEPLAQACPPGASPTGGDCIDCGRCWQACPTGIDIRRGLQLECIGCMACLDACNEVMRNIKKPEGLIRYASENEVKGQPYKPIRLRVVMLSLALLTVLSGLAFVLLTRPPIKAHIFSGRQTGFDAVSTQGRNPTLDNQFSLLATNYTFEDGRVTVSVEFAGPDSDKIKVAIPQNPVQIPAGGEKNVGFYVTFPKSVLSNGTARVRIHLLTAAEDGSWKNEQIQEVSLVGPY